MGINWAKLQSHPVHLVMLGLDAAGKTTVLYRLKFDEFTPTLPTIGFNCEKVRGTVGNAKVQRFIRSVSSSSKPVVQVGKTRLVVDKVAKNIQLRMCISVTCSAHEKWPIRIWRPI